MVGASRLGVMSPRTGLRRAVGAAAARCQLQRHRPPAKPAHWQAVGANPPAPRRGHLCRARLVRGEWPAMYVDADIQYNFVRRFKVCLGVHANPGTGMHDPDQHRYTPTYKESAARMLARTAVYIIWRGVCCTVLPTDPRT